MPLDCLWILSLRETEGLMVILCLLPVLCVLSRLMSPWGPSDLEQQRSLSVQVVPSRIGDTPPEWKSFLLRQRTRPEATYKSTGVQMLNQAPDKGAGLLLLFLGGRAHYW